MFLKTVRRPFLRVWELALLLSLCLTLLAGLWAGQGSGCVVQPLSRGLQVLVFTRRWRQSSTSHSSRSC